MTDTTDPQGALRDRIAEALAEADGWKWADGFKEHSPVWQRYQHVADAVLAVLLDDEASLIVLHCPDHGPQDQDGVWMDCHCPVAEDMRKRANELRRMADEAQQPETQAFVCKCPAELCHCGHHAAVSQPDGEA